MANHGLTVRRWCEAAGMSKSRYYNLPVECRPLGHVPSGKSKDGLSWIRYLITETPEEWRERVK